MKKIIFLLFVLSCSSSPSDLIIKDIYEIGKAKTVEDVEIFYTDKTVKLAKKIDDEILLSFDRKFFEDKSKYEIVSKQVKGDSAVLVLVITEHRSLNLVGLNFEISLKHEHGKWKIDRTDDLEEISKRK